MEPPERPTSLLEKYIAEIEAIEPLSKEEEISLYEKINAGDKEVLNILIKAHLGFVITIAKLYRNSDVNLSDLISEGNYGLIQAAQRFDPSRGLKFSSYALWWIKLYIKHALADQSRIVCFPLKKFNQCLKIAKENSRLEGVYQRQPSAEEIAESLIISEEEVLDSFKLLQENISCDCPLQPGGETCFLDIYSQNIFPETDSALMLESIKTDISRGLIMLNERSRDMLLLNFGLDTDHEYSMEEIAYKYDLTRERVRQIKEESFKRLLLRLKRRRFLGSCLNYFK